MKWRKLPEDIMNKISDKHGLNWDDVTTIIHLQGFIQEHCKEADFVSYIKAVAKEEAEDA